MERKIGEIFEFGGEWYQCMKSPYGSCIYCDMNFAGKCPIPIKECVASSRSDLSYVIFKKLEKVGEPYDFQKRTFQTYKLHTIPFLSEDVELVAIPSKDNNTIEIEIKQNKEDMEEKKQCDDNRFEVIEKAKRHLLHSTNIESNKEEMKLLDVFLLRCWQMGWLNSYDDTKHSNSEKIGKNLKKFNLEAAKAGKPVCTRDGHKARIICFDAKRKDGKNIIALVPNRDYPGLEDLIAYPNNGNYHGGHENDGDLMMLPEKKEGWVNVYKERCYETKEEALKNKYDGETYVDTVKIVWEE